MRTLLASVALFVCVGVWESESKTQPGEYCDTEVFRAECSEGQVILMTHAQYGRMLLGRCVSVDMGHIGCHADVLRMADRACSGRTVCEIRVPNAEFESVSQCMKELKNYFSVSYSCIPVEVVTREHCETYDEMNITSLSGYISNMVTSEQPECIGASHPWVVKAQPGQRINLTLYDFAVEEQRLGVYNVVGETAPAPKKCHDYGIIKEHGSMDFAICGGQERLGHLYLSDTHELRLWVTNDPHSVLKRFVIQYSVIGCAEPTGLLPKASWFDRKSHSHGYIRCNYDNVRWELICEGHAWTGHFGNCSLKDSVVHASNANNEHGDTPLREEVSMSMGIAIAIIIGAAFGLTLVLAIVCFFRYRRRRNRRFPSNRESILLRQKTAAECCDNGTAKVTIGSGTLQPVTTTLPETVHLTSDTDHPKGQSLSANSTPKCMHHHYHNVKINGSDYEHIWQSPLPNYPTLKAELTSCTLKPKHNREPTYTTFKVDNRQKDCVRPMYITSMDLFTGRAKVKEPSPYETCRYSTLPTKGHTRNNSCSKHQDLLL